MRGALYHERLVGAVQQRVNLVALACLALAESANGRIFSQRVELAQQPPASVDHLEEGLIVLLGLVGFQPLETLVYDSYVVVDSHCLRIMVLVMAVLSRLYA